MQPNQKKCEMPEAPHWLIQKVTDTPKFSANTNTAPVGFMLNGSRNNDLTSLAGYYRRKGLNEDAIFAQLEAANATSNDPLDGQEVRNIARSVTRNYSPDLRGELHDLPVSRIIAKRISDTCRYVPETGWRVYDGRSWVQDQNGIRAKEQIKIKIGEFVEGTKSGGDPDTARDARKYLSNNKINALISLLVSDPQVRAEIGDFDQKKLVLNLQNGTFDLAASELRPHSPDDMLTKVAKVEFLASAGCPKFTELLSQSLPEAHIRFLLRYLAYALQGDPTEQVLAILYGAGANGKSTVINAVSNFLGDYATTVEPTTLIKQKSERIRTDIARLNGVHLAVTSELGTGEILDAALVKRFTGGDTITARALYSSEFEYKPKFALVMTTNALPVIDGADMALARRLILIPFHNVVPEAERDPALGRHLEGEASGILNLLLIGLQDYYANGLALPDDLKEEVSRFAASSDMLASFLDDETERVERETAGADTLYRHYQYWCTKSGLRSLSRPQFKRELIKKGLISKRLSSGQAWEGLKMRRPHF